MYREEREDNTIYKVVVNHEEQYSIRLLCFAISGVNVILLGPNLSSG